MSFSHTSDYTNNIGLPGDFSVRNDNISDTLVRQILVGHYILSVHYCMFFTQPVRKCHISSEVAANFIYIILFSLVTGQEGEDPPPSAKSFVFEKTLESFDLVDARTLGQVFSQINPTTCLLDPIPTLLLKKFYEFVEEQLLSIVYCSLQISVFPAALKTSG